MKGWFLQTPAVWLQLYCLSDKFGWQQLQISHFFLRNVHSNNSPTTEIP